MHTVLGGHACAAALTEHRFRMTALAADMQRHVLDDAEHRHVDLLEHPQTFARIGKRDVLRRGDDDRARERHPLREGQLDIARAGRQVDDEVVEVAPVGIAEQLVEGGGHHRAAQHEWLLDIDQEPDRHGHDAMG